jgi:hypothetical protein
MQVVTAEKSKILLQGDLKILDSQEFLEVSANSELWINNLTA